MSKLFLPSYSDRFTDEILYLRRIDRKLRIKGAFRETLDGRSSTCRLCLVKEETAEYILTECDTLAGTRLYIGNNPFYNSRKLRCITTDNSYQVLKLGRG